MGHDGSSMEDVNDKSVFYISYWRALLLVILVLSSICSFVAFPIRVYILATFEWARHLTPWWGFFSLTSCFLAAAFIPVPMSVLIMLSGYLLGAVAGTITAWIGITGGTAMAFCFGRFIARDWVRGKISGNRKLRAIDASVGEQGFKVILLLRLSSIFPAVPLSYALGLTSASFWQHTLASWIGVIPACLAYVYMGSMAGNIADLIFCRIEGWPRDISFAGIGLVGILVSLLYISRLVRRALKNMDSFKDFDVV